MAKFYGLHGLIDTVQVFALVLNSIGMDATIIFSASVLICSFIIPSTADGTWGIRRMEGVDIWDYVGVVWRCALFQYLILSFLDQTYWH